MIKAILNKEKSTLVLFGLSRMNCNKLLEGLPIHIKLKDLGVEGDIEVVLMGGETEDSIQRELAKITKLPEKV